MVFGQRQIGPFPPLPCLSIKPLDRGFKFLFDFDLFKIIDVAFPEMEELFTDDETICANVPECAKEQDERP